jgi:hypothetical protein
MENKNIWKKKKNTKLPVKRYFSVKNIAIKGKYKFQ